MQNHIGRNSVLSAANPLLDAFLVDSLGFLATPQSLAFAIYDLSTPDKQNTPVEVVARATVDLDDDRIGAGHYAAPWSVGNASMGRHLIEWYATIDDGDAEVVWSRPFDVVFSGSVVPKQRLYATSSDVRAEGVGPMVSDLRILESIALASKQLEQWTHRVFVPLAKEIRIDLHTLKGIHFDEAIVGIESLSTVEPVLDYGATSYVVYNRHLRRPNGLLVPDDRASPRLEFKSSYSMYGATGTEYLMPTFGITMSDSPHRDYDRKLAQKMIVKGAFGFTDPDGSPEGCTPMLARRAVILMTLREVFPAMSQDGQMYRDRSMITSMKTREQSISYGRPGISGSGSSGARQRSTQFTGDPTIDSLIHPLVRAGQVMVI